MTDPSQPAGVWEEMAQRIAGQWREDGDDFLVGPNSGAVRARVKWLRQDRARDAYFRIRALVAWLDATDTILPDDTRLVEVPSTLLRDLRKAVGR